MQKYKYFFIHGKYFFYYFVKVSKMLMLRLKKNSETPILGLYK